MTATILRDSTTTGDPRLDRLRQFDEQSRAFPVRALVSTGPTLPSAKTWSMRDRLDQGSEGACVGFSMAGHVIAAPIEQRSGVDQWRALTIYRRAQELDEWAGSDYSGTSVLAGAKVLRELGYVSEYRWAFSLDDVIAAVLLVGPVVLGVDWHEGMMTPDADGWIRPVGDVVGGHAILMRGYDNRTGRATLSNSWGRSWGRAGDCYLDANALAFLLAQGGEACVPIARRA